jgi:hypothetical protein
LWRLGKKNPSLNGQLEDLEKAIHYLEKKREVLLIQIEEDYKKEINEIFTQPQMVAYSDPINGPE